MKKLFFALLALSLVQSGTPVFAETEATSDANKDITASVEGETKVKTEKKSKEDLDNEITNARLRAQSGSKSKWSGRLGIGYSGASLAKPFDEVRPNISYPGYTRAISLGLSTSLRYRLTKNTSLSAGAGMSVLSPYTLPEYSFSGVGVGVGSTYKLRGFQMSSGFDVDATLNKQAREAGDLMDLGVGQTALYTLKAIPLTMGMTVYASYSFFDKEFPYQVDYGFGAYPFLEYGITNNYSLRTLVGFRYLHDRQEEGLDTFQEAKVYQSVGLGMVITRDIYLYPNFQYIPEDARADRTNIALSATINIM